MATTTKSGYVNGSDGLCTVGEKAVGHCTSHRATFNSETKERAVKPPMTEVITKALFKAKGVTGLSIQVSTEGLVFYNDTESGFKTLFAAWKSGTSVKLTLCERKATGDAADPAPYLEGMFVVTSLERNDPANDDSTYSATFENDGAPTILDETKITQG